MRTRILFNCAYCNKEVYKILGYVNQARKHNPNAKFYCTHQCSSLARRKHRTIEDIRIQNRIRYERWKAKQ